MWGEIFPRTREAFNIFTLISRYLLLLDVFEFLINLYVTVVLVGDGGQGGVHDLGDARGPGGRTQPAGGRTQPAGGRT